jgi:hypothetical protein
LLVVVEQVVLKLHLVAGVGMAVAVVLVVF